MASRITESEKKRIVLYRKHHPTASYKDIAAAFDRSPSTVAKIIQAAKKSGIKGL